MLDVLVDLTVIAAFVTVVAVRPKRGVKGWAVTLVLAVLAGILVSGLWGLFV
jgi:hypothetical protein